MNDNHFDDSNQDLDGFGSLAPNEATSESWRLGFRVNKDGSLQTPSPFQGVKFNVGVDPASGESSTTWAILENVPGRGIVATPISDEEYKRIMFGPMTAKQQGLDWDAMSKLPPPAFPSGVTFTGGSATTRSRIDMSLEYHRPESWRQQVYRECDEAGWRDVFASAPGVFYKQPSPATRRRSVTVEDPMAAYGKTTAADATTHGPSSSYRPDYDEAQPRACHCGQTLYPGQWECGQPPFVPRTIPVKSLPDKEQPSVLVQTSEDLTYDPSYSFFRKDIEAVERYNMSVDLSKLGNYGQDVGKLAGLVATPHDSAHTAGQFRVRQPEKKGRPVFDILSSRNKEIDRLKDEVYRLKQAVALMVLWPGSRDMVATVTRVLAGYTPVMTEWERDRFEEILGER
jgi:hypothetical protein